MSSWRSWDTGELPKRLKLHGAFRSGTNYVKALLELNLGVVLLGDEGGWKHAPPSNPPLWPVIGVVRRPDTWLGAVWRYVESGGRKHITCGQTWHSFLRQPMIVTHGERDDVPSYEYASPVDYWNTMSNSLLSHTLIRYEDALRDPEKICDQIAKALGVAVREGFTHIEYRTRNMSDRHQRSRLEHYVTAEPFTASSPPRFGWRDRRLLRGQLNTELLANIY